MDLLFDMELNSLWEINENTWLFGDVVLARKPEEEADDNDYKANDGFCYTITEAANPRPPSTKLQGRYVHPLEYDPVTNAATWTVDGVVLLRARYGENPTTTWESTTLKWMQDQRFGFAVPKLLHHHGRNDCSFTIRTLLPGQLDGRQLGDMWNLLSDDEKVIVWYKIKGLYREMRSHTGGAATGVDGNGAGPQTAAQQTALLQLSWSQRDASNFSPRPIRPWPYLA